MMSVDARVNLSAPLLPSCWLDASSMARRPKPLCGCTSKTPEIRHEQDSAGHCAPSFRSHFMPIELIGSKRPRQLTPGALIAVSSFVFI